MGEQSPGCKLETFPYILLALFLLTASLAVLFFMNDSLLYLLTLLILLFTFVLEALQILFLIKGNRLGSDEAGRAVVITVASFFSVLVSFLLVSFLFPSIEPPIERTPELINCFISICILLNGFLVLVDKEKGEEE